MQKQMEHGVIIFLMTARVKVKDNEGIESDWSKNITIQIINRPPIAKLELTTLTPYTKHIKYNVSLKIKDNDGYIVSYTYDFGDGNLIENTKKKIVKHIYLSKETFM